VNHQSISDYPKVIPAWRTKLENLLPGYLDANPRRNPASISSILAAGAATRRTLANGWQGSGIFAISPVCRR
jgi:hypothetical protein